MIRMSPRRQGDLGELSAAERLLTHGYDLYWPVGHAPNADLVADDGERLLRVQVKTSTQYRDRRWCVTICTRGGNRSWSGLVKTFSASRCDWLFVLVGDGRRWFIPASQVEGGCAVVLGGPKYAAYEVDPGTPLPVASGP